MEITLNLPSIKDFRIYGRFHHLPKLDLYSEIPLSILCYVYPRYLFIKDKIRSESLEFLKHHCIILKEQADYEDNITNLKDQKELQIRRLEDRIHSYYRNMNKFCKCKKRKEKM